MEVYDTREPIRDSLFKENIGQTVHQSKTRYEIT